MVARCEHKEDNFAAVTLDSKHSSVVLCLCTWPRVGGSVQCVCDDDDFGYMPQGANGALRHGILYNAK